LIAISKKNCVSERHGSTLRWPGERGPRLPPSSNARRWVSRYGGADHPTGEQTKSKRASSRTRAVEAGEPLTKKAAAARKKPATDLSDGDVAKVPSLARARARDSGDNSGSSAASGA
jgi:hypothetical protein